MDFKTLYFLSVVDKLNEALTYTFRFCLGGTFLMLGFYLYMRAQAVDKYDKEEKAELESIDRKYFSRWGLWFFITSMVFLLLSSLVPGRRDIVEAYAMIEGSKIITAQNGEAVAKEVGLKFDRFLGIIAKGWGGEPDPAPAEPAPK